MADITDLYDSILIDIAGLSEAMALQELRNACIDFFTDTRVWTKDLVINSVGGQMAYTLTPDSGTDVVEILEVRYTGVDDPLTPGGPALLDTLYDNWRTGATGTPAYYYSDVEMLTLNLVLPPGSSATGGINCKIAQCPQKDSNVIPDWTERRFVDVIGDRMKARCRMMKGKPWSDANLAADHSRDYKNAVGTITAAAEAGFSRQRHRVRAYFR